MMETEIEFDNQSIISDITENNTVISVDIENKLDEINAKVVNELNKMTIDGLKEKCKELNISGISKMKKPDLVSTLSNEFMKLYSLLKDKKANELKNICKQLGIKGLGTSKKDILVYQILLQLTSPLRFKIEQSIGLTSIVEEPTINVKEEQSKELTLLEQLEKQRAEIESKMKEELEKQIEEQKRLEEEQKKIEEQQVLEQKQLEEQQKKKEKEETKRKKQAIPKNVRTIIWNNYIGEDIIKHKCLCCKKATICNTNFEVGHVLSEKNGGTHEINNLRPICFACNHSMGTENMVDYVVKYGLFIG